MSATAYERKVIHPYTKTRAHVIDGPEGVIALVWRFEPKLKRTVLRGDFFVFDGDYWAEDLGIHKRTDPGEDSYMSSNDQCAYTGGPCWYDGTALGAASVARFFVTAGEDAMWAELAEWYKAHFGVTPEPVGVA